MRISTKKVRGFSAFDENQILLEAILEILIINKPSLGICKVPHTIWARSVRPFWRLLDINKQTDTQADKQSMYIDSLRVCQDVCTIGPTFCVGPHITPEKVYGWSKLKKIASHKSRFLIIKIHEIFLLNLEFFLFLYKILNKIINRMWEITLKLWTECEG